MKKNQKPTLQTPNQKSKVKQQQKLERAIRFAQLKNEGKEKTHPTNSDEKPLSNKERKQAYYAQKVEKETERYSARKSATKKTKTNASDPAKKTTARKTENLLENKTKAKATDGIRLNKYLANSGIAARRKADEFIEQGLVKVNEKLITEMGYRVQPNDKVTFKGKLITPVNEVYILLNKPKNCVTTVSDERGRKTVMDIIAKATTERVFPVGRLDRNTTGLLLLTNDGDLAQKLSHPKHSAKKIYEVELDKPLTLRHYQQIVKGVELEDGIATVDEIAYAHPDKKNILGITLHIGKNRIVRRIFESLGYEIKKLDRTLYAGLTKKDLPRGRWRHLTQREIIFLKHMKS